MGNAKGGANTILMVVIALLVGVIGGYFVGQGRGGGTTAGIPAGQQTSTAQCPHSLDTKDQWIIAGMRCPGTDTAQTLLLDCHCPTAHGIMDRVKSQIAGGQSGDDIRSGIEAEYGDRLKFSGQ